MDDGSAGGELPPDEAGGDPEQGHRTAGVAEGYGLLETNHRARSCAGKRHTVVRVPSLPPIPTVTAARAGRSSASGGALRVAASTTGGT